MLLADFGTVTLALVPAVVAAIASVAAAFVSHRRGTEASRKVQEIKLLVDGRLDESLRRIIELEDILTTKQMQTVGGSTAASLYNDEHTTEEHP